MWTKMIPFFIIVDLATIETMNLAKETCLTALLNWQLDKFRWIPTQTFPSKLFLLQLLLSNHVALLIGILVSTGTLWKTLLYIIQYFYRGFLKKSCPASKLLSCLCSIACGSFFPHTLLSIMIHSCTIWRARMRTAHWHFKLTHQSIDYCILLHFTHTHHIFSVVIWFIIFPIFPIM